MMTAAEYRHEFMLAVIDVINTTGDVATDGRAVCRLPEAISALAEAIGMLARHIPGLDSSEARAGLCAQVAAVILETFAQYPQIGDDAEFVAEPRSIN